MLQNTKITNPNDYKVVSFHNSTEFGFTPDMGCMYDGRAINGKSGAPGIDAGESVTLPYHVGQQLAINLAKVLMTRQAPSTDPAGIPTGVPLWDTVKLNSMKNSFLTELYTEDKPANVSETDKLMARVAELQKFVQDNVPVKTETVVAPTTEKVVEQTTAPKTFQDKAEVLAELEKRGITHDKRKNKAELEKLLA